MLGAGSLRVRREKERLPGFKKHGIIRKDSQLMCVVEMGVRYSRYPEALCSKVSGNQDLEQCLKISKAFDD